MKINTNLRPEELDLIGRGLQTLSKSQRSSKIVTENNAEQEILRKIDYCFDVMVNSLQENFTDVLLKDK